MVKRIFFWGLIFAAGLFVGLFVASAAMIQYGVKSDCGVAMEKYGKDECVDGLIETLNDEGLTYRERNHAIWALGQLGDERGLETLKKYYTGETPDREPIDERISQYELSKAIKLLEGGFNATALFR